MEIIAGWTHTAFPIDDASRVGEARRHAAHLAREIGLGEVEAGRLALVVTELGSNLQRHAKAGQLLIASRPDRGDVEVISIDEGPGITDMARCMSDGYSTGNGSSPGTGLGAVRRLADEFDIHSSIPTDTVPGGTLCVARVRRLDAPAIALAPGVVEVGAVNVAAPGEVAHGDAWALALDGEQASLMVADGLGHGPEAAKASQAASGEFRAQPFGAMAGLLDAIHVALQTTRGAAVCCLRLDGQTVRCAGAGNVVARIVSGVFDRSMVTQHGTLGLQMRRAQEAVMALPPYAMVIVLSDGIETRWDPSRIRPLMDRDPALVAALLLREHSRKRDDATVVVLRRVH
ncbi:ATP-binding SpoIIE family protein phosphatase [Xylophilus sp. GOD-11R]|uniref:ATP-binding SpoIIE family protein phosphatase n=1 Tax=Xylophilus sp. GOD-11R TaxID=3089814 RepID=UPI00298CA900|nr:ATP-binding SpoIIE family protein phosphatase [Xylophilus sp. GOD-11R]WPB56063.1 ATP-binding SpoIIE family protein phosphatase [Xylophilus sp. GOD-11R]